MPDGIDAPEARSTGGEGKTVSGSLQACTTERDPTGTVVRDVHVLGVRLQDQPPHQIVARIVDCITGRQGRLLVVNANAHLLRLAQSRRWLRDLFERADIAFCDGAGAQLASWVLTGMLPHRSTPPEWIGEIAGAIASHGGTVFWLGGHPGVVKQAALAFEQRTGAQTAGYHHGFFDSREGSVANEALVATINAARPDLLLVNMGMPLQERWLHQHWDRLDVRVAITAGALVDRVAGNFRRPPRWFSNLGLEWVVRLLLEPKRLWRRYLIGLPIFAGQVAREFIWPTRQELGSPPTLPCAGWRSGGDAPQRTGDV